MNSILRAPLFVPIIILDTSLTSAMEKRFETVYRLVCNLYRKIVDSNVVGLFYDHRKYNEIFSKLIEYNLIEKETTLYREGIYKLRDIEGIYKKECAHFKNTLYSSFILSSKLLIHTGDSLVPGGYVYGLIQGNYMYTVRPYDIGFRNKIRTDME